MTLRDFIIYIANSPNISTNLTEVEPQKVLICIDKKEYSPVDIWVRGDNKLIIECKEKEK